MKNKLISTALSLSVILTMMPATVTATTADVSVSEELLAEENAAVESAPEEALPETAEELEILEEETIPEMTEIPEITENSEITEIPEETEILPDEDEQVEEPVIEEETEPSVIEVEEEEIFTDKETEEQPKEESDSVEQESAPVIDAEGYYVVSPEDWEKIDGEFYLELPEIKEEQPAAAEKTESAEAETEEVKAETETEAAVLAAEIPESVPLSGLVKVRTGEIAGVYYFDENGQMQTGEVTYEDDLTAKTSYFMEEAIVKEKNPALEEAAPYNSILGQMQEDYWYWDGTAYSYFNEEGLETAVSEKLNEKGFVEIDGEIYALNPDGTKKKAIQIIDGDMYYFDKKTGAMVRDAWVTDTYVKYGTWWRYFGADGKRVDLAQDCDYVATKLDASKADYVSPTGYYILDKNGYLVAANKLRKARCANGKTYWCYTGADRQMVKNKMVVSGGKKYYIGAYYKAVSNTLVTYNGKKYYFGSDSTAVVRRIITTGGKKYYFGYDGAAPYKNQWAQTLCDGNRYYYFNNDYSIKLTTGWKKVVVNGKSKGWLYFAKTGKHYKGEMLTTAGGTKYYFQKSGEVASGFYTINGNRYYFKPSTSTKAYGYAMSGIIRDASGKFIAYGDSKTKILYSGWKKIGDYYYYMDSNGYVVRNRPMQLNGEWGYIGNDARWRKSGWIIEKQGDNTEKRYYIDPQTGEMYKNCWKTIGGLNFYFTADGSIHTKLDRLPGVNFSGYNVSVNRNLCVMTVYTSDWRTPVRVFSVSTGTDATPSPTGVYTMTAMAGRWYPLLGSMGQWATHYAGDCLIHSIPYYSANSYTVDRVGLCLLGTKQSHGCIRMIASEAYWIYTHCNGSTLRIFDTEPTPLGTGKRYWIPEDQTYDPTDWYVPENHLSGPVWD